MADKATLNFKSKPKFPATNDNMLITSKDLCKYINTLMSNIFADFAGSKVYVDQGTTDVNGMAVPMNPAHPVQIELYFNLVQHDENEKRIYAFRSIVDSVKEAAGHTGKGKSYIAQVLGHNMAITQNKSSEITEDAMDILGQMLWYDVASRMSNKPTAKEFAKKGIYIEASTSAANTPYMNQLNNQRVVYNIVRFVDINSILSMLFDDEGEKLFYQVVQIKPIMPVVGGYVVPVAGADQKWLFNVFRINQEKFADLCNELGAFSTGNGMNIVTDGISR